MSEKYSRLLNALLFRKYSADVQEKLQGPTGLPILLLKLGEQLHIIGAELSGCGWRQGGRRKRCGGRGGSGRQGCGRRHLASHLTDRVGHRVLHPWESRTQPTSNLVCRHLGRTEKQWVETSLSNKICDAWVNCRHLTPQQTFRSLDWKHRNTLEIDLHLCGGTGIQILCYCAGTWYIYISCSVI